MNAIQVQFIDDWFTGLFITLFFFVLSAIILSITEGYF